MAALRAISFPPIRQLAPQVIGRQSTFRLRRVAHRQCAILAPSVLPGAAARIGTAAAENQIARGLTPMTTTTLDHASSRGAGMTKDEKFVIFASSTRYGFRMVRLLSLRNVGAVLRSAVLPARQRHGRAALGLRHLRGRLPGAPVRRAAFGRIGDLVGRKYTFLVTILVMGAATFAVGLLPTFADDRLAGAGSPGDLASAARASRSAASTAERRPTWPSTRGRNERGYATSFIQTTATLGFFLALLVIGVCARLHGCQDVRRMGLAHPVPGLAGPAGVLGLYPAQAQRDCRSSRR